MREYSSKISLTKNSRGMYSLDTSIGCKSGMSNEKNGCYGECYAAKSAKLYGYDFSKTVLRYFENDKHKQNIIKKINKIPLHFVRIGTSGDPSENWEHTLNTIKDIEQCNKKIVIITKHWNNLSDEQLNYLKNRRVYINTSVSALDKPGILLNSLKQYNRIKPYLTSILRITSCDFNLDNKQGKIFAEIQSDLFKNEKVLDNILRVSKGNKLIKDGIINIKKSRFLNGDALISKFNNKTYFGTCLACFEMCGINTKKYI